MYKRFGRIEEEYGYIIFGPGIFTVKDVIDGIKKQQKKWALDQIIESFPEL